MREFRYLQDGKQSIYEGWNRSLNPPPEYIALIRDEDVIDVLALDDPNKLDGVRCYVADNPCTSLLGVWRREPI